MAQQADPRNRVYRSVGHGERSAYAAGRHVCCGSRVTAVGCMVVPLASCERMAGHGKKGRRKVRKGPRIDVGFLPAHPSVSAAGAQL